MEVTLKQINAMNVEELAKLTFEELVQIRNKNIVLFNILMVLDLMAFYHSLFTENWFLLFMSFGIFISILSLYDNYRISKDLIEKNHLEA